MTAFYFKNGSVERPAAGGKVRYTWRQGYSELTTNGGITFPQKTRYEAMDQAFIEGKKAKFFDTADLARAAIKKDNT